MKETSLQAPPAPGYTRPLGHAPAETSTSSRGGIAAGSPGHAASIAIVGAGPRGTSLLERIGAHLGSDAAELAGLAGAGSGSDINGPTRLEIHIIDSAPHGAGRIWRTDQHRDMCMNTLSHAVTLFTEPGSSVRGPVREGPTLYEWSVLAAQAPASLDAAGATDAAGAAAAPADPRLAAIPATHAAAFAAHPARAGLAAEYRDELAAARPESHPSRALYGEYLTWAFERAIALLPDSVSVIRHTGRVAAIEAAETAKNPGRPRGAGPQPANTLRLDTGELISADAVVLATGWMRAGDSAAEQALAAAASPAATWVRQASPIEQDLAGVEAGAPVIVRGLGMSFFDTVALLTIGRGGEFVADADAPGGLRYLPSGAEPVVHATSGRGVPFRSKSLYGGLPPSPPQKLLRAVDWGAEPRPINFDQRLWPRIVGDAFLEHSVTLERLAPGSVRAGVEAALTARIEAIEAGEASPTPRETVALLQRTAAAFIRAVANRFDLLGELDPAGRDFDSPEEFDAWVAARVTEDLEAAEAGRDSALKAGLWSVSAARSVSSRIGALGGFDSESRSFGLRTLFAVGGMVGSGPPAFRNRQLLALQRAGIVRFIGPAAVVRADGEGFAAQSTRVAGSRVTAPALIDAWMHMHSLESTGDPLALRLLGDGRARSFRVASRDGTASVATGGFDIDPATGLVIHADGGLDGSLHVAGIPADQTLHDTVISPMPGTDPPMLRETDRVAFSALSVAAATLTARASRAATPEGALNAA